MKHHAITSLPPSPEAERHSRMMKYLLAMGIRVLCIIAVLFVRGWWLIIPAAGAIFLPYFAVLIANVGSKNSTTVERPGGLVAISRPPSNEGGADDGNNADSGSGTIADESADSDDENRRSDPEEKP